MTSDRAAARVKRIAQTIAEYAAAAELAVGERVDHGHDRGEVFGHEAGVDGAVAAVCPGSRCI